MDDRFPLPSGSVIGILGGGQLGRMLSQAATQLGFRTHIYCPEKNTSASKVSDVTTQADYYNETALREFAKACDVITYEFENVPADSARLLNESCPVFPPPEALKITQDRLEEKTFLQETGAPVGDFTALDSTSDAKAFLDEHRDIIIKTRRGGYDGKGQWRVKTERDLEIAYKQTRERALIAEKFIPFEKEISVIVARGQDRKCRTYRPIENQHENHILRHSMMPANIGRAQITKAREMARRIAHKLNYIGVLAVEMFVSDAHLLINELAPRVHNSGHLTMDACHCGQFEQHIRAIIGLKFDSMRTLSPAKMTNLIGEEINDWKRHAPDPNAKLYDYEKGEARAGRKMGHITYLLDNEKFND